MAIGASYEHDNAVGEGDRSMVMLYIKNTVMDDCKVGPLSIQNNAEGADGSAAKDKSMKHE